MAKGVAVESFHALVRLLMLLPDQLSIKLLYVFGCF